MNVTAELVHNKDGTFLILEHEKGRSIYILVNGFWVPRDHSSFAAMRDLDHDLILNFHLSERYRF